MLSVASPIELMVWPTDFPLPVIDWKKPMTATSTPKMPAIHTTWRTFLRQYHRRRRATTSCSAYSLLCPYMLGAGMSLWASTSTRPRKAMTPMNVPSSASGMLQPLVW